MPAFAAPVDAESLAIAYLAQVSTLTALVGADGVGDALPRDWNAGDRFVRVTRIGGIPDPLDTPGWLDRARLQVDAFGADGSDAHDLAALCLLALKELPSSGWTFEGAVVTATSQDLGITNAPDPDTDAARYLFGMVLYVHPADS